MSVFSRPLTALAALAAALGSGGCCSLATLFCGPDRSRWVSRDYRTPEAAVASFLEAIRRDRPDVVYESLSEAAKTRYGLPGVFESTVAWERLKREISGLHLAGTATVSAPTTEPDGRTRFDLRVAGRTLVAWLVEQPFWEVWYALEGADGLESAGRFVDQSTLADMLVVQSEEEMAVVAHVRDDLLPELSKRQIREVRVGRMWKVDELQGLSDP